jgi:membrane-associated phospholipid phosphatase
MWFKSELYGLQLLGPNSDFWSFPSGHTATAVALAVAFSILWPRLMPAWAVFAALIGFARIGGTYHYLSDVLMGGALAGITTLLLRKAFAERGVRMEEAVRGRLGGAGGADTGTGRPARA